MGKLGKRKKQRQELVPDPESTLTAQDLSTTLNCLQYFISQPESLLKPEYKPLRKVLYALNESKPNSLQAQISQALRDKEWHFAQYLLQQMQRQNKIPKLGALQRWIRDCDAAGEHDGSGIPVEVAKVLDAILRTSDPSYIGAASLKQEPEQPVRINKPWKPAKAVQCSASPSEELNVEDTASKFIEIYRESGRDRAPPNKYDMILYSSPPGLIEDYSTVPVVKVDCPTLPGVFILQNVFNAHTCKKIIDVANKIGFTPDVPLGLQSNSILAHNFFWLVDDVLMNYLYNRVKEHLPPLIGGELAGLNARWRVYRYQPGDIYRPHIDGAWPGSGITPTGEYIYDKYGDRWSKLTFLIRLNDDFEGGATTYFTPSMDEGYLDATPICPLQGDVLVFPHGDTKGTLLHEGSAVTKGSKYVVRTEVLYILPSHKPYESQ